MIDDYLRGKEEGKKKKGPTSKSHRTLSAIQKGKKEEYSILSYSEGEEEKEKRGRCDND